MQADGAPSRVQRNVAPVPLEANESVAHGLGPGVQAIVVSGGPGAAAGFALESPDGGAATSALTLTDVEVPTFRAASCARAESVYVPLAFGVHVNVYGAAYFAATTTPFAINSTLPTPMSSEAVTDTVAPEEPTRVPAAGAVTATLGGVVSGHAVAVPARTASAASRIAGRDDFGVSSA
jgi:hypothetical protein